jgi:hypothetical protein
MGLLVAQSFEGNKNAVLNYFTHGLQWLSFNVAHHGVWWTSR